MPAVTAFQNVTAFTSATEYLRQTGDRPGLGTAGLLVSATLHVHMGCGLPELG